MLNVHRCRRPAIVAAAALAAGIVLNDVAAVREERRAHARTGGALVSVGDVRLNVRMAGRPDRSTIVLLHGFAGSLRWWAPTVDDLATDHRVIAVDLLGHGGSDKPRDGYAMSEQADLVAQLLAAMRVRSAVVAGHSMGGYVATAMAERHPALVRGVALLGTAPTESLGALPFGARLATSRGIGPLLRDALPDRAIAGQLESAFGPGFAVPRFAVDDVHATTFPAYRASSRERSRYRSARSVADRLAALDVPVLALIGTADEITEADGSIAAYRAVEGANVLALPRVGHTPQLEQPAATAEAIRTFSAGRGPNAGA